MSTLRHLKSQTRYGIQKQVEFCSKYVKLTPSRCACTVQHSEKEGKGQQSISMSSHLLPILKPHSLFLIHSRPCLFNMSSLSYTIHSWSTYKLQSRFYSGNCKENGGENEDFFGIPEQFELQQTRINPSSSDPKELKLEDLVNNLKHRPTRTEKRMKNQDGKVRNFLLKYGNVSIDSNVNKTTEFDVRRPDQSRSILSHMLQQENYPNINKFQTPDADIKDTSCLTESKHQSDFNNIDEQYFGTVNQTSGAWKKEQEQMSTQSDSYHPSAIKFKPDIKIGHPTLSQNRNIQEEFSPIDEQFFGDYVSPTLSKTINTGLDMLDQGEVESSNAQESQYDMLNPIDEQYFGDRVGPSDEKKKKKKKSEKRVKDDIVIFNKSDFNTVYEQYFGDSNPPSSSAKSNSLSNTADSQQLPFLRSLHEQNQVTSPLETENMILKNKSGTITAEVKDNLAGRIDDTPSENVNEETQKPIIDGSFSYLKEKNLRNYKKTQHKVNSEQPSTAYDYAMQIRQELRQSKESAEQESSTGSDEGLFRGTKARDGKGYQLPISPSIDWDKMTKHDVLLKLKRNIIFMNDDFIAIDKPYGLPSVGQPGERLSIQGLLPDLVDMLPGVSQLHWVQGLDRSVSGTLLVARSSEKAAVLKGMFNTEGEIIQRYWAITKGVPMPYLGIIDIPICEKKVRSIYKMVLRPRYSKEMRETTGRKTKNDGVRAETQYRVLDAHEQSALVECELLTNKVKDQLRVHLSGGLNTPVLGDHKYSHFTTLKPQKLHKSQLELLKIRQASVRQLGLHLHCRSIILKNYEGKMLFLSSRPPLHFKASAEKLKLTLPQRYQKYIDFKSFKVDASKEKRSEYEFKPNENI